jgi:hypothetical protein
LGAVWLISHLDKGINAANTVPLAVLGANLPDIIDKPIGIFAPELGLGTGRGIAHTLAFNLALLAIGLGLTAFGRVSVLYIGVASIGHLVLDYMWSLPKVLFWPLYGFAFPQVERRGFKEQIQTWWHALQIEPCLLATEVIGLVFIVAYILQVYWMWR